MILDEKSLRMRAMLTRIAKLPTPPRVGRPATGRKPQPEYQQASKQRLLDSGGRRLTVNLSPRAAADLQEIRERDKLDTDREAIESALSALARRRPKKT